MAIRKTLKFDSIRAVAAHLDDLPRVNRTDNGGSMEAEERDGSWCAGVDLDEAHDMARTGGIWEDGARDLMDAKLEVDAVQNRATVFADDYDVTGHTLDVGEYLAGNPTHWIGESDEEPEQQPILRVCVHIGRRANIPAKSVMLRGAAVLSVVDSLEAAGRRVELYALWGNKSNGHEAFFETCVKKAEDHWSPSSVAFSLCHPAFSRRLMFRMAEGYEEISRLSRGFGNSIDPHELSQEYDLFFERQVDDYCTAEEALRAISRTTMNQLKEESHE